MSDFQFNLFRKLFVIETILIYAVGCIGAVMSAIRGEPIAACLLVAVVAVSLPPARVLPLWKYVPAPVDPE